MHTDAIVALSYRQEGARGPARIGLGMTFGAGRTNAGRIDARELARDDAADAARFLAISTVTICDSLPNPYDL